MTKGKEKDMSTNGGDGISRSFGAIVRTYLAGVPGVGEAIATAWSEWDTNRRFHRVESTVRELAARLAMIADRLDPISIGDEELQLLEEVLRRVQIEHRELKRQRFAQLLVGTWTSQRHRPFDERMSHIMALEEFSDLHIEILKFVAGQANSNNFPSYAAIGDAVDISHDRRDADLVPALDRLASGYGYIKRAWDMKSGGGGLLRSTNLSTEGIARNCDHTITDAGRRFLAAIAEDSV
jgi:hypothetical protein